MRKLTLLLVVALIATISIAFAQNRRKAAPRQNQQTCFVDTNSNGICDKYESATCDKICTATCPRNGSGCRYNGTGCPNGAGECPNDGCANFVDADNNGVCDNRERVRTPKFSKKRLNVLSQRGSKRF